MPPAGDNALDVLDRALIGALPQMKGLSAAALDDVLTGARAIRLSEGDEVFVQGEPAGAFYLLAQGRIKVQQVTPEGQQVLMVIVSPGELFGIAAAIGRSTYPGTAIAASAGIAVAWPSSHWEGLAARHPEITRDAILTMGRRLQETHARLRELSTERVERRIAHVLLRLVRQAGRQVSGGVMIDFPLTRQDIAEMTGTTLHTVSRTLSGWEQSGILIGGRRRIIVHNAHALVVIAGD